MNKPTSLHAKTPLAILSAQVSASAPVAVLAFELQHTANDGWYQLLPAGYFAAGDGRPADVPSKQWFLDAQTASALIARNATFANDRPADYEHQTLNAEKNGAPAPASGWFNASEIQWREGSGLWVKPRWTDRAKQYIANKEYRYLSAVFPYDETTGHPLYLHSIALTNDPGLDGLNPLTSLKAGNLNPPNLNPLEKPMDPILKAMLTALGVTVAEGEKPEEAACLAALKAVQDKAALTDTLSTQVAALKATPPEAKPDPAKYVPIAALTDLQSQLAVLKAGADTNQLTQLIAAAKADGRLLPSLEEWANELGKQDLVALKAYLDKAAPIAALKATQTQGKPDPDKTGVEGLSYDELEAAKLTGKTPKEFAALKAKQEEQ